MRLTGSIKISYLQCTDVSVLNGTYIYKFFKSSLELTSCFQKPFVQLCFCEANFSKKNIMIDCFYELHNITD